MTTFIMVHTVWHGGWSWEEVAPVLEANGHRVLAPDLPGMGSDRTPWTGDVLRQWADAITALVEAEPEPVMLVGHGRGAAVVDAVTLACSQRIAKIISVASALVIDGKTLAELNPASQDVLAAQEVDETRTAIVIDAEQAPKIFYPCSPAGTARRAAARLCPEPVQPWFVPLHLDREYLRATPRAYVETLHDPIIPLDAQRAMQNYLPGQRISLKSDHFPSFCLPDQLAKAILDLALA